MMLYLQGSLTADGEHILCPLSSSVILFFIRYSQTNMFELVFVPDSANSISMCCTFRRHIFSDLSVTFTQWNEVPSVIRNVSLPSLHQPELSLVRSGLCVLLRHIIRESHTSSPHLHLIDLLVSGFTKLCEVELPETISHFISALRDLCPERQDGSQGSGSREVIIPSALIKLDDHFRKRCRVHNDNKRRREEIAKIKHYLRNQISFSEDKIASAIQRNNDVREDKTASVIQRNNDVREDKTASVIQRNNDVREDKTASVIQTNNDVREDKTASVIQRNNDVREDKTASVIQTNNDVREDKTASVIQTNNDVREDKTVSVIQRNNDVREDKTASVIQTNNDVRKDKTFIVNCGKRLSSQKLSSLHSSGFEPLKHSTHNGSNESFTIKLDKLSKTDSWLQIDHVIHLPHGIHRLKIDKHFDVALTRPNGDNYGDDDEAIKDTGTVELSTNVKSSGCVPGSNGTSVLNAAMHKDISELVGRLTYLDVQYEHTYSEGVEMTMADLILYVYTYHLLEAVHFRCALLVDHIPSIIQWADHMTSLATVVTTGQQSGWDMDSLAVCLGTSSTVDAGELSGCLYRSKDVVFVKETEVRQDGDEDEMELSRCAKMKHKALKPEVTLALQKFEMANIRPVIGKHPCGDHVNVDWDDLPAGVHPREGDVPKSRTDRKCQQLENLVTAVQSLHKPGSVLVDFCSGGGHLGIIMAYLLPDCQVYLVENKEESLLKACSRLESLVLTNVTMYQCNLDYFISKFDVGVCLHACGSATDMVLQLCLNCQASFVICPCCYGSIQKTHLLAYPQSKQFMEAGVTYKDFLTLGHAADQTEFNIALEEQGRLCMNLVDTDRAERARELGYHVTLCSLMPLTCSPKNNLLVGTLHQE